MIRKLQVEAIVEKFSRILLTVTEEQKDIIVPISFVYARGIANLNELDKSDEIVEKISNTLLSATPMTVPAVVNECLNTLDTDIFKSISTFLKGAFDGRANKETKKEDRGTAEA